MARNKAGFSISDLESGLLIAAGRIDGVSAVSVRGVNLVVGTSYEDLRLYSGTLTQMAAATKLEVASSSESDKAAGTGALTVRLSGYDGSYDVLTEDIVLTGNTIVVTTGVYFGVNSLKVLTAGTGLKNAGDLYAADDSDSWVAGVPQTAAKVLVKVPIGYGQSRDAIYTVPAGFTAYVTGLYVNAVPGKTVTFRLVSYDLANVSEVVEIEGVVPDSAPFDTPAAYLEIAEKTTIRLQAKVSATTAAVQGGFELILIDNSKV